LAGALLLLVIAAPIFGFRRWKARFDFGRFVDFKDNQLGSVTSALSFGLIDGLPTGASGAGIGGLNGCHGRVGVVLV